MNNLKIEFENGSSIESLSYANNVSGKRKYLYPFKKASELRKGDVFLYDDREQVAIEDYCGRDGIWVTTKKYFIYPEQDGVYGYTNAYVMSIHSKDEVKVLKNLLLERKMNNENI